MDTLKFEWDEDKNEVNIRKHGISFETAALVFMDDFRLEDFQYVNGEERYATIGKIDDIIVVVYTMRNETHRLISARPAEKQEIERYYGYDWI